MGLKPIPCVNHWLNVKVNIDVDVNGHAHVTCKQSLTQEPQNIYASYPTDLFGKSIIFNRKWKITDCIWISMYDVEFRSNRKIKGGKKKGIHT